MVLVALCACADFCAPFSCGAVLAPDAAVHLLPLCRWGVLFSHPADFTPVCTTELGVVAKLIPEFEKRNTRVCALSCDPVDSHLAWIKDIQVRAVLVSAFAVSNCSPALCNQYLPY